MNTRGTLSIFIKYFFLTGPSTKHLVDQLSANYIGFYRQGSGKSDKYGSFLLSEWNFHEVRRVFKFFHKIDHFKLNFALKIRFLMGIMFRQV